MLESEDLKIDYKFFLLLIQNVFPDENQLFDQQESFDQNHDSLELFHFGPLFYEQINSMFSIDSKPVPSS